MEKFDDITNSGLLGEEFSNFRAFGIGKRTKKQEESRAKRKEKYKIGGELQVKINGALNKLPLAVPRGSALTGLRVNLFGLSTRLYPALITEEEAKKRHFDLANREKAIKAMEGIRLKWRNLGGDVNNLESAIRKGYDKPVFKHSKKVKAREEHEKNGFDGDTTIYETALPNGERIEDEFGASAKYRTAKEYNPFMDIQDNIEWDIFDGENPIIKNVGGNDYVYIPVKSSDSPYGSDATESYSGCVEAYSCMGVGAYISLGLSVVTGLAGIAKKTGTSKNPYADKQIDTTGMDVPELTPEQQKELDDIEKIAKENKAKGIKEGEGDTDMINDGTIMGMSKTTFYIGIGAVALIGGYLVYRKFIAKK